MPRNKSSFRVTDREYDIDRKFVTLFDAVRFARKQCAETGQEYIIRDLRDTPNGDYIAYVRKDALDRVWTDVCQTENPLI
jgi:hypothetical protein